MGLQLRQGDILLERVTKATADRFVDKPGCKAVQAKDGRLIVAEGEATGHNHAVVAEGVDLLQVNGEVDGSVLIVKKPTELTHEEHAPLDLPTGVFVVTRQREYVEKPPTPPPPRGRSSSAPATRYIYD